MKEIDNIKAILRQYEKAIRIDDMNELYENFYILAEHMTEVSP